MNTDLAGQEKWQFSHVQLALLTFSGALLVWAYWGGLDRMMQRWATSEEYGYGYMIPLIVGFFIWQKKNTLEQIEFTGSYFGVLLVVLGGALLVLGELATLYIVVQYAFLVTLFGFVLSVTGWRAFKEILPALCLLVFMIPLPNFLYQGLSAELQLISSQLGVAVIRMFGISVYLEGNVIDLGAYQLQVVEACSGLRYLFPLAALSYMAAYIFKGAVWKKILIFVSSAPITVLMNSFRIGVIGVLVEHYGIEQAEGFLHDFEGWVVFMACMGLLVAEMWFLSRIGRDKYAFADAFAIELPESSTGEAGLRYLPASFKAVVPVVLVIAALPLFFEHRSELVPERKSFAELPVEVEGWSGRRGVLEKDVIEVLQFSDYWLADYVKDDTGVRDSVNLYIAYYESQRKGASIHSPRSCIPGGGWKIQQHEVESVELGDGRLLSVNRLVIQKGSLRQLVYYWFQQRGRVITNEYMVKWYLFLDAMMKNRTDGALLRLTTMLEPQQDIGIADQRLRSFAEKLVPLLPEYIPD